jgi:hypothetical protein
MFLPHIVVCNECAGTEFDSDVGNLSVESGVGFLLSSDDDFEIGDFAMVRGGFKSFGLVISIIPDDTNCFLLRQTIGVVDECP